MAAKDSIPETRVFLEEQVPQSAGTRHANASSERGENTGAMGQVQNALDACAAKTQKTQNAPGSRVLEQDSMPSLSVKTPSRACAQKQADEHQSFSQSQPTGCGSHLPPKIDPLDTRPRYQSAAKNAASSKAKGVYAILLAAGSGQRLGGPGNKVYLPLAGKSLLEHTLLAFLESGCFSGYLIVVRPGEEALAEEAACRVLGQDGYWLIPGGQERQDSVKNALDALPPDAHYVAVHDAARCLVSSDLIRRCVASAQAYGSGVAVCPAVDTVKEVSQDGCILSTLPREKLALAQTPQVFLAEELRAAHQDAAEHGYRGTDDASLLERFGRQPHWVEGEARNLKVTHPEDFYLANALFTSPQLPRVGMGYDVHQLAPGRKLVLGGVEIPHSLGLLGHSDADVLLHAIMDALLGAANLGDIGHLFPDTDPAFQDASSLVLLEEVGLRVRAAGYALSNLDATLALEAPKIAPYREAMVRNIAAALGVSREAISVKATTTEGLGFVGRKEGAAAYAVCCLLREGVV